MKYALIALFIPTLSFAAPKIVTCTGTYQNKIEKVQFKLNAKNEIVQWDDKILAKAEADSWFEQFSWPLEEEPYDYLNAFWGHGGYYIVEFGTTADAIKVGVNYKEKKGFFDYSDHGSGNGNFKFPLICK